MDKLPSAPLCVYKLPTILHGLVDCCARLLPSLNSEQNIVRYRLGVFADEEFWDSGLYSFFGGGAGGHDMARGSASLRLPWIHGPLDRDYLDLLWNYNSNICL
jgi:hypothetical protein